MEQVPQRNSLPHEKRLSTYVRSALDPNSSFPNPPSIQQVWSRTSGSVAIASPPIGQQRREEV